MESAKLYKDSQVFMKIKEKIKVKILCVVKSININKH